MQYGTKLDNRVTFEPVSITRDVYSIISELEDNNITVSTSKELWEYLNNNRHVSGHLHEIQYFVEKKIKNAKTTVELSDDPTDVYIRFIIRSDRYADEFIDIVDDISQKMCFSDILITSDFKKA
ncbi:MAG: hypothetical protein FWH44_00645 [Methanomassiliicoccaceae archaeon]|nr:hypothetical protein [Methanomassiliicoccaceae archaeon]